MRKLCALAAALLLGLAPAARAQFAAGNIYGTVHDDSGAALPGAAIKLTGPDTTRGTVSSNTGDFRFLNLGPGTYTVTVSLTGFASVKREVVVNTGVNASLVFGLKVASVEETVTVTSETPVVDPKRTGTSTTLTHDELALTPNARDPWAVLRTVPGVLVDRVNIAGSESGQQAIFTGKGSTQADAVWAIDGVVVTDPAAAGGSPAYYDFDAFQEISYTTGGNDVRMATSAVGINFVTKRGTNAFHGGGHWFFTHDDLQSSNLPDELKSDRRLRNPDGTFRDKADHIDQISDYGFDLGGPIVKDKLWFWGSYGKQDIRLRRLTNTRDKTLLPAYNGKITWQASPNDVVSGTYFMSDKKKFGRPTIALPEADSHLRNQKEAFASSFPGFWKAEWNHTFSPDLMINGKYAFFDQGFTLTPRGGTGLNELQDSVAGVALGASPDYRSTRPIHTVHLDANYFHGHHEFKAGFYYRTGTVTSSNVPPGDQILALRNPGSGLTASEAVVERASISKFGGRYLAGYVADTLGRGRLTLNLGLRFDHQQGENKPSTSPANVSFPSLLPDLSYDGSGPAITWNDLSPRLGFTYALSESRKTLVRGSFARYAGQLAWGDLGAVSPVGGIGQLTYHWNDLNGDGFATPDEVDLAKGQLKPPVFATLAGTINQIDPQYHASHDLEVIAGIERELIPNLAVAAAYTWKRTTGAPWAPFIGLDRSGFTALPPVSANGYTAVAYTPGDEPPVSFTGGLLLQNRRDYHRQYSGVELTVNKRLSNRWLGRVAFSYASWTEHFTGNGGIQNPTPTLYDTYGYQAFGATVAVDALKDSGQFVTYASGRTGFLGGKWQLSADALYQLPLNFEIAGALFARQGYPLPVNITVEQGFLGTGYGGVLTQAVDALRLPDLWNLDVRLAKNVKLGGATLTLTADAFNVLNAGTPLTRNPAADSAVFKRLDSILNPRIVRFGARFQF